MPFFENLTSSFPIFGIIFSLILFLGLYQIGSLIFKIRPVYNIFKDISDVKYQKILISVNFILLIFYPLILYSNKLNIIPYLSVGIFSFGIINILRNLKKAFGIKKVDFLKKHFDENIALITLFLLFLLSLSPNTHGDSLGYHFVVAKKILFNGTYAADITHFHSILAGSGEILIAIGLFFGSEQFGSLVQFSGLISIYGIFKKLNNSSRNNNFYFYILIMTSPVILFLASTAKPQLFHICSTALVFSLYFFDNKKVLSPQEKNWQIIISIFILIVSVSAKFNFTLSSFLIGLFILYNSFKDKNFLFLISTFILSFSVFYLPIIIWKWSNFGGIILQYFYSPVPLNIIGMEEFKQYLTRYGGENSPIEIFFTFKLNQFTNSVGIAFLYLFAINFKNSRAFIAFIIVTIYCIVQYHYGQFVGRSFLEPLIWILLICARYGVFYKTKIFDLLCRAQAFVVIGGICYGVYSLFPGSLTASLNDKVLSLNANGYALFKWANSKLDKEDVAFSMHKSISLGKSQFIAMDFIPYVDFTDNRSDRFAKIIYEKNPKFLLTWGPNKQKPYLNEFKNCVGEIVHYQENVGKYEARNPLNRGGKYDGYIFKLKKTNFPNCIK